MPIDMPPQYFQFNKSPEFEENTIFERRGDDFSPIMGNWDEAKFKERSGGAGFDRVRRLNTTFRDVLKANPTWKQKGVILPKDSPYELYGEATGRDYNKIADMMKKFKQKKKYKFSLTDAMNKSIDGKKVTYAYDVDKEFEKQKALVRDHGFKVNGTFGDYGSHYEVKVKPNRDKRLMYSRLGNEIGHSVFNNYDIPEGMFMNNNGTINSGGRQLTPQETIADHFSDYLTSNDYYRFRYPEEAEFFDKYLKNY